MFVVVGFFDGRVKTGNAPVDASIFLNMAFESVDYLFLQSVDGGKVCFVAGIGRVIDVWDVDIDLDNSRADRTFAHRHVGNDDNLIGLLIAVTLPRDS